MNKSKNKKSKLSVKFVEEAYERLKDVVTLTPLQFNKRLSEKYKAKVYLKREDLQVVRSYKLRGAYNRMALLSAGERRTGVVCASAGNHAQGVAFSCEALQIKGHVYMPRNTPKQKVERVRALGGEWVTIELVGDTFDECSVYAQKYSDDSGKVFVHPFDDVLVMAGQGTVGLEVLEQFAEQDRFSAASSTQTPDVIVVPVGGGGLLAGLSTYVKAKSPHTKVVGVEPQGAPSMTRALEAGHVVTLDHIDTFVDGAAVKTVGQNTFAAGRDLIDTMLLVPEGKVCEEMIALYQNEGVVTEPAGALSVAALDQLGDIEGKTVVCIVSGGNNDISRYPEVMERSLQYLGLKQYFVVEFPQRPGALRRYLDDVLGENDDITIFEYMKKNNKETGPALVGVELSKKENLTALMNNMQAMGLKYEQLQSSSPVFKFLI